ncbi:hypothetical protein ABD87_14655 [Lysinibacillus sphaericus]|uniref:hypothetical protein n=1 Tax=Lysinibacillus sphaericus TaxID=1421 RepID=UPI0018CFC356|nr:hypothetical protein [Lysinibacillus sphaericus]MBG9730741.1 hypothetical protein [Lysinibacillus sphaericus]
MNRVEVKKRKQRSDKKRDVKPYLTLGLKRAFSRLSYITDMYEKDLAEDMILYAINDSNIVSQFSLHFKHDVIINNTVYIGRLDNPQIAKRDNEDTDRISTRLKADDYEVIRALAFGLDCSVARVCALLINACMQDINFVNGYVKQCLSKSLTVHQMRELRNLLKSANKDAEGEHYSWGALLSQIIDESPIARIKDAVGIFISKRK